ncbi:ATP-dependent DNA helicase RecG [Agaricicola taiwanensis]|uniref:ATP-dependent DNA helicase RecG n=1 Tax=Agaricicola taiwanensis TaxID=591372 RepID=A0A8J2YID2_9RHOB|nr:ATP-dependent DNA helicase RecG [Agaricicola taiwanensis]GGE45010.1 ATP-dependent DNA helicase RecG [Agaricicola taiwanensis]
MRPHALTPYFASLSGLTGVGPKVLKNFTRLLDRPEPRVRDLLFHLPTGSIDRRIRPTLAEAQPDTVVTVEIEVEEHRAPPRGRRGPYRVTGSDGTGWITLVFFHGNEAYLQRELPPGARRWVSGKLEMYDGMLQMVHPDRILDEAGLAKLPLCEPTYPLVEGLTSAGVGRTIRQALDGVHPLPEWLDTAFLKQRRWPDFISALKTLHLPEAPEDIGEEAPARLRLAYDELLASQLALALVRARFRAQPGISRTGTGVLVEAISQALPYALTGAQERALADIHQDLAAPKKMLRLLQGDVGSGKTVVALMAMAYVAESGGQSAMMAPTEILARQHLETIAPIAEKVGLRIRLLTGREKGRERAEILQAVAAGEVDILVGTHALFQEHVVFSRLGLAVVDEQHRFGVHQRLALAAKGDAVDVLVMTATPIPRTLVLTYFGDMDVSALDEKPAGRKPIDTRLIALERLDEVVGAVGRAVANGARVYWVCPLVSESETLDVAAAEDRFAHLAEAFPGRVALVHGQMKGTDKDAALAGFQSGETPILIATTVIEVGVNVPEATVMVIEHAERFGLAQLHQLRGRIGRGDRASTCLLLYKGPLGEVAKSRLEIMRETEDGFRIAEEDLKLRGEGEVLGTRQSGAPVWRMASIEKHGDLLEAARRDAALVVARDPELTDVRGEALRHLLYLFERDEAVRLLRAG